jgi:hypothetical protein
MVDLKAYAKVDLKESEMVDPKAFLTVDRMDFAKADLKE